MISRPKLSAILITKDEEHNIYDCLSALDFCDEILILDNGSEDNTVQIARSLGATVHTTPLWAGYGPQKQRALDFATGDWILSIDADERITGTLRDSILEVINSGAEQSYQILRKNYFLGKEMRFGGWSNDWVTRLSKREHCKFSDDAVHERLLCKHPGRRLSGYLLHTSYLTVDEVFKKQIKYAELGATKLLRSGSVNRSPTLKAISTFIRLFVVQLGFLDGWRGAFWASAKSYETFWRYALSSRKYK